MPWRADRGRATVSVSADDSLGVCWSLVRPTLGWQREGAEGSAQASLWGVRGLGMCVKACAGLQLALIYGSELSLSLLRNSPPHPVHGFPFAPLFLTEPDPALLLPASIASLLFCFFWLHL